MQLRPSEIRRVRKLLQRPAVDHSDYTIPGGPLSPTEFRAALTKHVEIITAPFSPGGASTPQ